MWARAPSCQASITHWVQETETMLVISVILKFSFLISGVGSGGFDPSHSYAAERFPMMHWACLLCVTTLHFTNFVSSLLVEFVLLPLCQMSLTLHCACLIFWSDLTMFIVHLFFYCLLFIFLTAHYFSLPSPQLMENPEPGGFFLLDWSYFPLSIASACSKGFYQYCKVLNWMNVWGYLCFYFYFFKERNGNGQPGKR